MSTDQDRVFYIHEVCRGPVVHIDMKLTKDKDDITTTLKHASGDGCRTDTSFYMFLLNLEKINEAICYYKSTGAGFNCDPKTIDDCQLVLRRYYRNFTGSNEWEEQILRLKNAKNTPMSLSMRSRLASTSNPIVWAELENKPKSLKDILLPDIPTQYKERWLTLGSGICCVRDRYVVMGHRLIAGWPDANGICHKTPVIRNGVYPMYSFTRNEEATICNDINPKVEYSVCFGHCNNSRCNNSHWDHWDE